MALSKSQKKYLVGICHGLKPVVMLGQKGLTEAVLTELGQALDTHELVKVKLRGDRAARRAWLDQITDRLDCEVVQKIGMTACVYRPNPEGPGLELPA